MKKETDGLMGKLVTMYLDGGLQFVGAVESADGNFVTLLNEDGILIIDRDRTFAILVHHEDTNTESRIEPVTTSEYHNVEGPPQEDPQYYKPEENTLGQGNHYGSVLPTDMLLGKSDEPETDFAVTMSSLRSVKPKKKGR